MGENHKQKNPEQNEFEAANMRLMIIWEVTDQEGHWLNPGFVLWFNFQVG